MTYRALDLFCGAGGASMGLHRAGFEVVGVDIAPQPHYPFEFHQADALMFPLEGYDFIWASPVCKRFSSATRTSKTVENWPDQIDPIRELLTASGAAWVIENVTTAPIRSDVLLCGAMFNLRTYRHRVFESNFFLFQPPHPKHTAPIVKMGRQPSPEQFINPVGNFIDVRAGRIALDIDWMTRDELAQSIPPAYSEFIGKQIISQLSREAA